MILITVILLCGTGISNVNAAEVGKKYISSKYGYLTGKVYGYTEYQHGKIFNSDASTTKNVPKIRTKLEIQYYSTGVVIGKDENGWLYNCNNANTTDYYLEDQYNKITKKYDKFVNTKCKAYGTADAITSKSYTVYTSCVY